MRILLLFTILIYSAGCSSESIPDEVIHPVPEKLPPDESINFVIDIDDVQPDQIISQFSGSTHSSINESVSGSEFIELEDVTIDSEGNLYTRTLASKSIEVYNFNGNYTYAIGREGNGPGEFNNLRAMDFDSSFEHLYALDMNEIEVYSKSENGQFTPTNTIYHGLSFPTDICVLGDHIFVSGMILSALNAPSDPENPLSIFQFSNTSIHSFNVESGELADSFGHTYQSYSGLPFLDASLTRMFLSCNETTDTIVGLFANYGYFFGYDIQGETNWISKINNFNGLRIRENGINSPTPGYGSVPDSTASSFTPFRESDSQMEIIQIRKRYRELSTLFLDPKTGELFYGGTSSTIPVSRHGNAAVTITFNDDDYHSASIQTINVQ